MKSKTKNNFPVIWLDLDGVFANFSKGIKNLGLSETNTSAELFAEIDECDDFWRSLEVIEGSKELLNYVKDYKICFLTAFDLAQQSVVKDKIQWVATHLDPDLPVVVTRSFRKPDFLIPGDILIDDYKKNIERWNEAGGIGIRHKTASDTISQLKDFGIIGEGKFTEKCLDICLGKQKSHKRKGFTGYQINKSSQKDILKNFGIKYQGEIEDPHVTREFHNIESADRVFNGSPEINIVGHHFSDKCEFFVVTVDGTIQRPDGKIFHLTWSVDDVSPNTANKVIEEIIKRGISLVNREPFSIKGDFCLFPTDKMPKLKKKASRSSQVVSTLEKLPCGGTLTRESRKKDNAVIYRDSCQNVTKIIVTDKKSGEVKFETSEPTKKIEMKFT